MAKPWRDIISANEFASVANARLGASTARQTVKTGFLKKQHRHDLLNELLGMIRTYHQIDKQSVRTLAIRRAKLLEISREAELWFTRFDADRTQAADRGAVGKYAQSQLDYSMDRNMLTLVRQSLRKADYLDKLADYCQNADPQALLAYVHSPQLRSNGVLGLDVRMEKEDFMHRDGFEDGPLRSAFETWAADAQARGMPFFLWLETHPICTTTDRTSDEVSGTATVEYVDLTAGRPSATSKMRMLAISSAPIRMLDLTQRGASWQTCDTDADFSGGFAKKINPSNGFGRGVACFVWSPHDEVFIAEHRPGAFHHSSFLGGANVKCAGMIRVQAGMVTEISNNSGHYKPPVDCFRTFAGWLHQRGVLTDSTYVKAGTGGAGFTGTYQEFRSSRFGGGGLVGAVGRRWRA